MESSITTKLVVKRKFRHFIVSTYGLYEDERMPDEFKAFTDAVFVMKMTQVDVTPAGILPFLFVGSIGTAYSLSEILKHGIDHVLCLSNKSRLCFPDKLTYLKVDVTDSPDEDITQHFDVCFNFIERAKSKGGKCLVHCFQGKSRSIAICCAYLIKTLGLSLEEALSTIKSLRPLAEPNSGFVKKLQQYQNSFK